MMLASAFVPVRYFGFLVVVSIGACLLGAVVLTPAICLLFRPRFLEPTLKHDGDRGSTDPRTKQHGGDR